MRSAPANPAPSATVVLLRERQHGPEVLLVLRHAKASFGASYVFPGGLCDAGDERVADYCDGIDAAQAGRQLSEPPQALSYYSAALRELFEETGILLATRPDANGNRHAIADNALDEYRDAVYNGSLPWQEFLDQHRLRLSCEKLRYFAWWVTPRPRARRFSTRFFMATLPDGQEARHDGNELTDSCWLRPADALAAADGERLTLPPPTQAVLGDLAAHDSVADMLLFAAGNEADGVACVLPAIVDGPGGPQVLLPDDDGYPSELAGQVE